MICAVSKPNNISGSVEGASVPDQHQQGDKGWSLKVCCSVCFYEDDGIALALQYL